MFRINVKLGGINTIPEPRSVTILTDPHNPTIVMGVRMWLSCVITLLIPSIMIGGRHSSRCTLRRSAVFHSAGRQRRLGHS